MLTEQILLSRNKQEIQSICQGNQKSWSLILKQGSMSSQAFPSLSVILRAVFCKPPYIGDTQKGEIRPLGKARVSFSAAARLSPKENSSAVGRRDTRGSSSSHNRGGKASRWTCNFADHPSRGEGSRCRAKAQRHTVVASRQSAEGEGEALSSPCLLVNDHYRRLHSARRQVSVVHLRERDEWLDGNCSNFPALSNLMKPPLKDRPAVFMCVCVRARVRFYIL